MIIDVHGHITSPAMLKRFPIPPSLVDIEGMLEKKAAAGIDLTIVGTPVGAGSMIRLDGHDNYAQTSDELRAYNEWIAETVAAHPGRLKAYAYTNPFGGERMLSDAAATVREGEFVGVIANTSVRGEYLDSERADDFFAMISELGVPVFLHPPAEPVGSASLRDFRLVEQVGRYCDAMLGLAALIFGGRFEQYPDLEVVAATSAGALALVIDRLDTAYAPRHWEQAGGRPPGAPGGPPAGVPGGPPHGMPGGPPPGTAGGPPPGVPDRRPPALRYQNRISKPPSAYLRNIYVDTTAASPANQVANLEAFGADRMMFGTDSPPLDTPFAEAIDAVRRLPVGAADHDAILGGNAARLFKLDGAR
jgi:aminocarboxymuconate-semialdehyde decarboxylase